MQLGWNETSAQLISILSLPEKTVLTSPESQSLFVLKLRQQDGEKYFEREYGSLKGWNKVRMHSTANRHTLTFTGLEGITGGENFSVSVIIQENRQTGKKNWYESSAITLSWGNPVIPDGFSLENASLLPLSFRRFGEKTQAFYPYSSGIVCEPFQEKKDVNMRYPAGFGASMAWFALWDEKNNGIYIAAHDQTATAKDLVFSSDPENENLKIVLKYPAENLGQQNSRFAPCTIVLTGFSGDWYDAATLYRQWVRNEAAWYPRQCMTNDGRSDTPLWMKELSVWVNGSDSGVEDFQAAFGVPVGLHWYNWHQIPFDNDYPHYFPAKTGFGARVAALQKDKNIFVMPYINGRLWDTRDHGATDSLFTTQALAGVTKQEDGKPWTESYGSKETDGTDVQLGVMCPTSEVWRRKQNEIVLRLTKPNDGKSGDEENFGVNAVYIDQIAAAPPVNCFDKTHNHPAGGGDWWVSAYDALLKKTRAQMPEGAALTTESNAESYVDVLDGFLVWQFQDNGQVPAFAAVYGGAIQLFGRAYSDDDDLATKMRLAESFVYGEQIGWMGVGILKQPERLGYMKKVVYLRHKFREYFYKGQMRRPPLLLGNEHTTTTWKFLGPPKMVTTDAVRAGAWSIPHQNKTILMFAGTTDRVLDLPLVVNPEELGFDPSRIRVVRHHPDGSIQKLTALPEHIKFEPEDVLILEIQSY